jgi:HD domain
VPSQNETLRALVTRLGRGEIGAALSGQVDPLDLDRLTVPDSRAYREAERVCLHYSSVALANHCFRSYAWGALLGTVDGIGWDPELLYAAAMLHDLGLTERYDIGGSFESDGAAAAREILADVGLLQSAVETVAEAIHLHMHVVTPRHSGEAQLLAFGAAADVTGQRMLEIIPKTRSFILATLPRAGIKQELIALFEDQAHRTPDCIVETYMANGLGDRILAAPFDDDVSACGRRPRSASWR